MTKKKKLNAKHKMFCKEYLIDFNATQAATRAGYSKKTAGSIGFELLKKPEIAEYLEAQTKKRCDRLDITADKVLQELAKIGFSDIREMFDEDGKPLGVEDLKDKAAAAVQSVNVTSRKLGKGKVEYTHNIKLADKKASLELLGKHLKLFSEQIEHGNIDDKPLTVVVRKFTGDNV